MGFDVLACWQAGDLAPAVKYLRGIGRKHWPSAPKSDEEIGALFDEGFLSAEMPKLLYLLTTAKEYL